MRRPLLLAANSLRREAHPPDTLLHRPHGRPAELRGLRLPMLRARQLGCRLRRIGLRHPVLGWLRRLQWRSVGRLRGRAGLRSEELRRLRSRVRDRGLVHRWDLRRRHLRLAFARVQRRVHGRKPRPVELWRLRDRVRSRPRVRRRELRDQYLPGARADVWSVLRRRRAGRRQLRRLRSCVQAGGELLRGSMRRLGDLLSPEQPMWNRLRRSRRRRRQLRHLRAPMRVRRALRRRHLQLPVATYQMRRRLRRHVE